MLYGSLRSHLLRFIKICEKYIPFFRNNILSYDVFIFRYLILLPKIIARSTLKAKLQESSVEKRHFSFQNTH